jgi:hypothetical protein
MDLEFHAINIFSPFSNRGDKFNAAKKWRIPAVSVQWLNDVLYGNVNPEQSLHCPKYQTFRTEDPLRIEYSLVPHLVQAWKQPIRVTPVSWRSDAYGLAYRIFNALIKLGIDVYVNTAPSFQETYNKFKANPPARIKRKAERQRLEKEEAKRMREAEELRGPALNGLEQQPLVDNQQNGGPLPLEAVNPVSEDKVAPPQQQPQVADDFKENNNDASRLRPRVVLSGFSQRQLDELRAMVLELGGEIIPGQNPRLATHLVMPKLGRTISFLCALPYVRHVLASDWIRDSKKERRFLGEHQQGFESSLLRIDRRCFFQAKRSIVWKMRSLRLAFGSR